MMRETQTVGRASIMTEKHENEEGNVAALLAVLRRLDAEYALLQGNVDAVGEDSIRAGRNLAEVIVAMSRRSEELRAANKPLVDAVNDVLRDLCGIYLEAQEELRASIRNAFAGQTMLLVHLINLTGTACLAMPRGDAPRWFRTALAALSIEDNRTDYRDTLVALEHLHASALKAGIDPKPYLEEAASLSSAAMRDSLAAFARRHA